MIKPTDPCVSSIKGPFKVDLDARTTVEVRCKVKNLSFSAHADAKGIMQLIKMSQPANIILVHGEKGKMYVEGMCRQDCALRKPPIFACRQSLKQRVKREFNIPCFDPANGSTVTIKTASHVPIQISPALMRFQAKRAAPESFPPSSATTGNDNEQIESEGLPPLKRYRWAESSPAGKTIVHGMLLAKDSQVSKQRKVCMLITTLTACSRSGTRPSKWWARRRPPRC